MWELVKRTASLETKVDKLIEGQNRIKYKRKYFLNEIKKLRVEKFALQKYVHELEGFLKVEQNERGDLKAVRDIFKQ